MISNAEFLGEIIRNSNSIETVTDNKSVTFFNIPMAFDIETSSFYYRGEKTAIMYEWTLGIGFKDLDSLNSVITYGRNWETFITLINALAVVLNTNPKSRRLVIYCHNLPYEWQFIRKRFKWDKVFYIDDRKPVYAVTENGIEFRCSLKLSGMSLANTAKDLVRYKAEKMIGDLDYSLIRHKKTPLTKEELGYCENDVKVILCYIQEKIENDGDITKIPLTKTGYVRRACKRAMFQERELYENENAYDELDLECSGVSPTERVLSRRIYPRFTVENRYDSQESWFIRLYEFLSGCDSFGKISDGKSGVLSNADEG